MEPGSRRPGSQPVPATEHGPALKPRAGSPEEPRVEASEAGNRPRARQIGRASALVCGVAIVLLAAVVLIGWALDVRALIQVHPTFAPMQPNTALGFLLLGSALALLGRERRAGVWLGVAAGLAAVAARELSGDDVEPQFELAFVVCRRDALRTGQEPEHLLQMFVQDVHQFPDPERFA